VLKWLYCQQEREGNKDLGWRGRVEFGVCVHLVRRGGGLCRGKSKVGRGKKTKGKLYGTKSSEEKRKRVHRGRSGSKG